MIISNTLKITYTPMNRSLKISNSIKQQLVVSIIKYLRPFKALSMTEEQLFDFLDQMELLSFFSFSIQHIVARAYCCSIDREHNRFLRCWFRNKNNIFKLDLSLLTLPSYFYKPRYFTLRQGSDYELGLTSQRWRFNQLSPFLEGCKLRYSFFKFSCLNYRPLNFYDSWLSSKETSGELITLFSTAFWASDFFAPFLYSPYHFKNSFSYFSLKYYKRRTDAWSFQRRIKKKWVYLLYRLSQSTLFCSSKFLQIGRLWCIHNGYTNHSSFDQPVIDNYSRGYRANLVDTDISECNVRFTYEDDSFGWLSLRPGLAFSSNNQSKNLCLSSKVIDKVFSYTKNFNHWFNVKTTNFYKEKLRWFFIYKPYFLRNWWLHLPEWVYFWVNITFPNSLQPFFSFLSVIRANDFICWGKDLALRWRQRIKDFN